MDLSGAPLFFEPDVRPTSILPWPKKTITACGQQFLFGTYIDGIIANERQLWSQPTLCERTKEVAKLVKYLHSHLRFRVYPLQTQSLPL